MHHEWDSREQGAPQAVYRAHLRELTAARQAAERARDLGVRDRGERQEAEAAYQRELARIAESHQAWLQAHGITDPPEPRAHSGGAADDVEPAAPLSGLEGPDAHITLTRAAHLAGLALQTLDQAWRLERLQTVWVGRQRYTTRRWLHQYLMSRSPRGHTKPLPADYVAPE